MSVIIRTKTEMYRQISIKVRNIGFHEYRFDSLRVVTRGHIDQQTNLRYKRAVK
jgi:hypothetical protein